MSKLTLLCGPPQSGKTAAGIKIAQEIYYHFKGSVIYISADTVTPFMGLVFPSASEKQLYSLGEALEQLREALGTDDFELMAHRLSLPGAMFTGFITDGVCHCCGEPIRVMRHEGRTSLSDLRCPDCTAKGLPAQIGERFTGEKMVYGFSPASEAELKALTLFELGYPLGAHIDVLQRGDALDITDACVTKTVFAFDGDHEQMHRVTRL